MNKLSPESLNFISRITLALVDDSNAYRTHNAISIYSAIILGTCTIAMTAASIFCKKSLSYELATLVAATAGLAGYQFGKAASNGSFNPPNNTGKLEDKDSNNSNPPKKIEAPTEGEG